MDAFRDQEAADRRRKGLALKALRQRLGISQGAAAEAAGFSSYKAWQYYENGERKFSDPKLLTLLTAINADREEFDEQLARIPDDAASKSPAPSRGSEDRAFQSPYQLPLAGFAHGGPDRPNVADDADRELVDLSKFFAPGTELLRLGGMSMWPYAEPGGFITFNRKDPAKRGEGCVVVKKDGTKLVKRFESYRDDLLIVTELWPKEREITIPLDEVLGVYNIGLRGS